MRNINLIKAEAAIPPELESIQPFLQKLSLGALAILIVGGTIAGGLFLSFRLTQTRLEGAKQTLVSAIGRDTIKEGLLSAIKQRTAVVQKIQASQKPMGTLFDAVAAVVSPVQLVSMSFDTTNRVIIAVTVSSVQEAVTMTKALVAATQQGRIKNPELVSFTLGRDGQINASFAFVAATVSL